jgi:hypothetical protein
MRGGENHEVLLYLKPWAPLFTASRRSTSSVGVCRIWDRRHVRAPVAIMVIGMVIIFVVDLSGEEDVWFMYLHL